MISKTRLAEKFELEVWIAARGSECVTERQGQCRRTITEFREADVELLRKTQRQLDCVVTEGPAWVMQRGQVLTQIV